MTGLVRTAVRPVRMAWRRLTSMRTALILLFLLAVAAVPGSILPQRPLNDTKTSAYIASHGGWGTFLDRIGAFDVFGSVWFAAIYLLLFLSLVGCLIPRIRLHARAAIRKPLPAPRNLSRLPESGLVQTSDSAAVYADAARHTLGRRWRVTRREEPDGVITLSAEKGYSRESGNLIFHLALLSALILIAVGKLYSYQGTLIVNEGDGFCNSVSQYDSWKPGRLASEGKISPAPFCITELNKFTANYTADGAPSSFAAQVSYKPDVDAAVRPATIKVNHPLRLEGDRVYLINHGFAPQVTIRMPDGTIVHDTQSFVPTNATTFLSEGAFKEQGKPGAKQDIGISGLFAPSPIIEADGSIGSGSPQVKDPTLAITVYVGDLNYNGQPQSVYSLDTSKMTALAKAESLKIGQTQTFDNGVTVTFDGWVPWVSFQVSHDPAQGLLLIAAVAMVLGLLGSLGVRRRRLWLRITPAADPGGASPTVVSVGGLARSDSGNFNLEFTALLKRLREAGTPTRESVAAGKE